MQNNHSEIVRLKEQFELEYTSAYSALHGPAKGAAQHKIITAKMQHLGEIQDQLTGLVGEEDTATFIIEAMNHCSG